MVAIFNDVFTGTAATGGFLGAGIAFAFNRGVNRGLFSNEAGQGSAPIVHASARAHEPVSEGLVALLEPFIDTIIICSLTGLTLLASGVWSEKVDNRFQQADMIVIDGYIVTIGLLMFAFSTSISWSYYGGRAITYLFGIKYFDEWRERFSK